MLFAAPDQALAHAAARNVEAFRRAIVARDVGWFERTFASDYVGYVGGASLPRSVALAQLRKGLSRMPRSGVAARIVTVRRNGAGFVARVMFDGTLDATMAGRAGKLHARWSDEQGWAPTKAGWRLLFTRTSNFDRTIESGP